MSASFGALGINAHLDVPIAGGFLFTLTPEYLHALGASPNPGIAAIRAGFGFELCSSTDAPDEALQVGITPPRAALSRPCPCPRDDSARGAR